MDDRPHILTLSDNQQAEFAKQQAGAAERARKIGEDRAAIRAVEHLEPFTEGHVLGSSHLIKARCIKLEALIDLGEIETAESYLKYIESVHGVNYRTRRAAAKLHELDGKLGEAAAALRQSIICLPLGGVAQWDTNLELARILSASGKDEEARSIMETFPSTARKASFYRALRLSIHSLDDVGIYERIAQPDFTINGQNSRHSLYHLSVLYRELSDYKNAQLTARERYLKATEIFEFGQRPKAKGIKWIDQAEAALHDLKRGLHEQGHDFFLISGIFLGCVREGTVLGHDKDIDIGVPEDASLEAVTSALKKTKRFSILPIKSNHSVYVKHASGVNIDIFRHYSDNGRYYHEGPKARWWNSPFEVTTADFLGDKYPVPSNPDQYLTENYGDWRVPNSEFETFVDTPNMEITNFDHMIWYYLSRLSDYHVWGKLPQFMRVWDSITSIYKP